MRLTDQDAAFLYQETASCPMHGCQVAILEGELPFEEYVAHFESRIHLIPRFRQRLAYVPNNWAHPKWVDDPEFKIENHIKRHRMPPGSTVDDAVAELIRLNEPLLPRDRPLWLTYVIEGVPDRTVIAQQGHHAFIDGSTAVDIALTLFDLQPNAAPPPPPNEPWDPEPLPTPIALAAEAAKEIVESISSQDPLATASQLANQSDLVRRGLESMTRFITDPAITAPWNASMLGPKRNFMWRKYGFDEFRRIRRAFGGTINDVVLAMVTEGAARYLEAHGEPVGNGKLRIMCPVNVRREGDSGVVGNRVSGVFPAFPARPMPILERMADVIRVMSAIKANQEAQALEFLRETSPAIPPVAMAQTLLVGTPFDPTVLAARAPVPVPPRMGPRPPMVGVNFTCTNVPGVQTTQYLRGHRMLDYFGVLMLGGNMGYGLSVMSYNRMLSFNFICDPRLMPDLDQMVSHVQDAYDELLAAAEAPASAAAGT